MRNAKSSGEVLSLESRTCMKIPVPQLLFVVALLTLVQVGCGGTGSPFESVPVSGKVTYERMAARLPSPE